MRYNFDMSKETFVFIVGALIFFSPFMGLPREYTKWFLIGAGIVLMILGYRLRRLAFLRSLEDGSGERRADVFVENVGTLSDVSVPKKEEKLPEAQPVHAEPELKLVHTAPAIENKPTQAGEPAVTYETKKEESVKPVSQEQPAAPDGLKSVFTIVKARDISERLAMSPVADIAKAMSINDKMLILKELFGNDTAVFNESITKLNGFSSFDEAKNYLIQNIAVKYNWVQEERLEKAEAFVKLVSRRYS